MGWFIRYRYIFLSYRASQETTLRTSMMHLYRSMIEVQSHSPECPLNMAGKIGVASLQ